MVAFSVMDSVDVEHKVAWAAEHLIVPVRRGIHNQSRVHDPSNELGHRNLSLQPCERTAKTEVDAAAKAEVLIIRTLQIDFVGVFEALWVTVSGCVHHDNRRALRDSRSVDLELMRKRLKEAREAMARFAPTGNAGESS